MTAMADAITAALERAVQDGVFPGAVLLVQEGADIRRCDVVGFSTVLPTPEPMTRATLFDLASLTKPIATTTMMLLLIQRGLLALDQPVAKWLPDFVGDEGTRHPVPSVEPFVRPARLETVLQGDRAR